MGDDEREEIVRFLLGRPLPNPGLEGTAPTS